jgi:2'-5' RNA ligase
VHRLFVAIRAPDDIVDRLVDIMDDSPELRWVAADNIHLTLRFIGEVERPIANDIADALRRVRADSFALRLTGVGMFDQRNGGALWAGAEPRPPVMTLAAKVDRACQSAGIEAEHRAFHPHITIARYRRQERALAQDFLERNRGFATADFTVDRFTLFESRLSRHGAHYEEVASFDLAGRITSVATPAAGTAPPFCYSLRQWP